MQKRRFSFAVTMATGCLLGLAYLTFSSRFSSKDRLAIPARKLPVLEFVRFEKGEGELYSVLKLTNTTNLPVYFAGYGPTYPLQTWERFEDGTWTECGYHWCGTGRSIEYLEPHGQLDLLVLLREYKTEGMPEEPTLSDYRHKMRLVLYYGHTTDDIRHPLRSNSFAGTQQTASRVRATGS
jgi:hypothetical protein